MQMPFIEANWVWLLIALVVGAAILWWVWGRSTAPQESAKAPPKPEPAAPAAAPKDPPEAEAEAIAALAATSPIGFGAEVLPPIVAPLPVEAPAAKKPAAKPKAPAAKAPAAKAAPARAIPEATAEPAISPAAKPAATKPKPVAKPKAAPAAPDNLLQLKGVGPKLVTLLAGLGVTRFAEIAAWKEADIARIDAELGTFKGRIVRDHWIEQAGYLAKGDVASFEAKFGKLDG